jgi:glutamyl-tRNA synthetase
MKSLDASLRDPNLFRIIDAKHVFTGDTYSVWPAYDFAVVVEDHLCKITHVLRSQEFHTALQEVLRKDLGFAGVEIVQFSRFNFKGTPFSKREIRPLIEKKIIKDWDDPRLPTVAAAKRRGFLPEAIREFTVQVGYGKAEHTFDWELFYAVNRKLLDPISRRLFFVPDPVALRVEKAPLLKVKLDFHPENDLGHRELETAGSFFIPEADAESLKPGEIFRLKDLYNVKLTKTGKTGLAAEYAGKELVPGTKKVQWTTSKEHAAEVVVPDVLFTESGEYNRKSLAISKGCIEPSVAMVKVGEVVQLERFGFARLDEKGKVLKFIFTHK